jgi:hypothetical protein
MGGRGVLLDPTTVTNDAACIKPARCCDTLPDGTVNELAGCELCIYNVDEKGDASHTRAAKE